MRNECKAELFRDIMAALEEAGHRLGVLHGYKDYPERIDSDVDIVSEDPAQIPRILSERKSATVVQAARTRASAALWYVVCRWCDDEPVFLSLHVCADCRRHGRVFLRGEDLLNNSRWFKFFRVPSAEIEFSEYLIKKLTKGSLTADHGRRLSELYEEDPAGCGRRLAELFPETDARLIKEAARSVDWGPVQDRTEHLRHAMSNKVDREKPLEVLRNRLSDPWGRIQHTLQPAPGLMVALLGVDGAGKSTVMAHLVQDLAPAFWSVKLYHGRALESPLRWTKRVRRQRQLRKRELEGAAAGPHAVPVSRDPHAKPSKGFVLSLVKLGLWWTDYTFLGYLADVYPRLRRSGLVLFDRYYQDLLVDPRRHRYGGPMWLAHLAGRFFPRPHLVVLLDAPPEVLHSRKQEVPLEETARQRKVYLELVRDLPNGYVADASKPAREVASEVEKVILDYMAARTAQRLKR